MISVTALTRAINESAYYGVDTVPAYKFATDNINESSAEFAYSLAASYADFNEIMAGTDEIIAEAALSGASNVYAINENAFTGLKDQVVKFFKSLIEKLKGMWNQIKAYYFKFRQKTDEWLKTMDKEINKISGKPGYKSVEMEMNDWNSEYLTGENSGIASGITTLVNLWKTKVNSSGATKSQADIATFKNYKTSMAATTTTGDAESDTVKRAIETAKTAAEQSTSAKDAFIHTEGPAAVKRAFGISGDVNVEDNAGFTEAIRTLAHGGKETKTLHNPGADPGVDTMKTAIKNSSGAIKKLQNAYSDHIATMNTFTNALAKEQTLKFDNNNLPANLTTAITDQFKALYGQYTAITNYIESYLNTAKTLQMNLIGEMNKEYMAALMKLIKFKGNKESKD